MTAPEEVRSDSKRSFHFPPDPIIAPIATASGIDLARDPESEAKAHPVTDLAMLPLTTPLRRLTACEYGAAAAGTLAVLNLLGLFHVDKRPLDALIGPDPNVFIAAQLIAAALAAALALLILSRHGLWACEVVLAWTLFELYPPGMRWLYGHGISGRDWDMALGALGMAMAGVVGAWAIRRAGPQAPPPAPRGPLERLDSAEG